MFMTAGKYASFFLSNLTIWSPWQYLDYFWNAKGILQKAHWQNEHFVLDQCHCQLQIRLQNENLIVAPGPSTAKDYYEEIYLDAFENIIQCLEERFDQKGLEMYDNLQQVLILAAKKEDYEEKLKEILYFSTLFKSVLHWTYVDRFNWWQSTGECWKLVLASGLGRNGSLHRFGIATVLLHQLG